MSAPVGVSRLGSMHTWDHVFWTICRLGSIRFNPDREEEPAQRAGAVRHAPSGGCFCAGPHQEALGPLCEVWGSYPFLPLHGWPHVLQVRPSAACMCSVAVLAPSAGSVVSVLERLTQLSCRMGLFGYRWPNACSVCSCCVRHMQNF